MSDGADLRVLWYRAPAMGVGWHPEIVGDDDDAVERTKAMLRKRFSGKGGVETMVKEYCEMTHGQGI